MDAVWVKGAGGVPDGACSARGTASNRGLPGCVPTNNSQRKRVANDDSHLDDQQQGKQNHREGQRGFNRRLSLPASQEAGSDSPIGFAPLL